jgi:hypothetical protein
MRTIVDRYPSSLSLGSVQWLSLSQVADQSQDRRMKGRPMKGARGKILLRKFSFKGVAPESG